MLGRLFAIVVIEVLLHGTGTAQTCDRACLNGFVDQYLAALVAHDPSRLPLTKTARYTENGQTLDLGDGMWGPVITPGSYKLYLRDRRFPVVDEKRGLVLDIIRFDHSGKNKTTVWNDGSVHPVNTPFDEPFSFQIAELFKIKDGKINRIEALGLNVPYGMPTGWSTKP